MLRNRSIATTLSAAATLVVAPLTAAYAADVTVGDLVISHAWTRVTPPGARVAGGFLTITNKGKTADRLIGGTASFAGRLEVHEMSMDGGVMKMREVAGGLQIEPGATVELKPGGYHVMFMDLQSDPQEGTPVTGTLKFENAGEAKVAYDVAPLGAKSPGGMGQMDHSGHDMKKMQDHKHGH